MFESMLRRFRLGAVWVPTNFRHDARRRRLCRHAQRRHALICNAPFPGPCRSLPARRCPSLRPRVVDWPGGGRPADDATGRAAPRYGSARCAMSNRDDPCWFFFTSGTTGRPKAAVLTHGQMAFVAQQPSLRSDAGHDGARRLARGRAAVARRGHPSADAGRRAARRPCCCRASASTSRLAWRLVEQRVTNMFTVPTILKLLVEHPAVDAYDHSSLRYVIYAGAPMYRADQKRALERSRPGARSVFRPRRGHRQHHRAAGRACIRPTTQPACRFGTCGYERTGMEVSIQDEAGNEVAPRRDGRDLRHRPGRLCRLLRQPRSQREGIPQRLVPHRRPRPSRREGFLSITGRASDMYISGGSNIYPREIEEKILMHPAVAEVSVARRAGPEMGRDRHCRCVPRTGMTIDEAELIAWLRGRIAGYKVPRRVFVWSELPKSGYGKITKKLVRDAIEARGGVAKKSLGATA